MSIFSSSSTFPLRFTLQAKLKEALWFADNLQPSIDPINCDDSRKIPVATNKKLNCCAHYSGKGDLKTIWKQTGGRCLGHASGLLEMALWEFRGLTGRDA
jgi:hypothetical protein